MALLCTLFAVLLYGLSGIVLVLDCDFSVLLNVNKWTENVSGPFNEIKEHPVRLLRGSSDATLPAFNTTANKRRGAALCTGAKMIADAKAVIDQFRNVWNSALPIAIIHCEELNADHTAAFSDEINVQVFDICQHGALFGMDHHAMRHRLRSWYCKAATLILAPFDEVMVVDLDTIWFKKPDIMFDAPSYLQTGALFMRDRITHDNKAFQDEIEQFIYRHNSSITMTSEYATEQLDKNGVSFFWRNTADRNEPRLNNFEDSSVVIINKNVHPKLLQTIAKLIPTFSLGWGDKEMYWIAATIAGEDWSFEPFLSTLYGPCGLIMHYDPTAIHHPHKATPMYVNAEWLVEKIVTVGHDLEFTMPNPILATKNVTLFDLASARGCGCSFMGCRPMAYMINQLVLRAQWERKTRVYNHQVVSWPKLPLKEEPIPDRNPDWFIDVYETKLNTTKRWHIDLPSGEINQIIIGLSKQCVPVYSGDKHRFVHEISDMVTKLQRHKECHKLGCAFTPIQIYKEYHPDALCLPVSFNPAGPEEELKYLTVLLTSPPPPKQLTEGEVLRGSSSKAVFLYQNGTLHMFPNGDTFVKMGFEWGQVKVYYQNEVDAMPVGLPLPAL